MAPLKIKNVKNVHPDNRQDKCRNSRFLEMPKNYFALITVSFFLFFISSSSSSFSQTQKGISALFVLKGTIKLNDKSVDSVLIELKKDNKFITSAITKRNGKYKFEMDISTTDPKNEYLLYITKKGTVPKSLIVNTYLSKEAFMQRPFVRFDFDLDITLNSISAADIIVNRPSGKIMWDTQKQKFAFDQTYLSTMQKEKEDDGKQSRELEEKKRKAELEAKLKAEREAKLKAEREARELAERKAKEEAERILQQNLEAMKKAMRKQREEDSLAALNKKDDFQKFVKPVSAMDVDPNAFDGTEIFSVNNEKKSLKALQEKINRKKAANLSAKYETNNILTSLLNMVDENEKNEKTKIK